MGCSPSGHKNFLLSCNIGLLIVGLAILVLASKMKIALSVLSLIELPMLSNAVKAVIATGFFISLTGTSGICSVCYQLSWLIIVHLVALGIIVIMEFSLGITLMVIRNTVESTLENVDCGKMCTLTLDSLVLNLAMPSAGLMMTIIIIEALMLYSGVKFLFYVRSIPKGGQVLGGPSIIVQNVQMQNVAQPPQPPYAPQPQYTAPQPQFTEPQPQFTEPQPQFTAPQPQFTAPQPQYSTPQPSTPRISTIPACIQTSEGFNTQKLYDPRLDYVQHQPSTPDPYAASPRATTPQFVHSPCMQATVQVNPPSYADAVPTCISEGLKDFPRSPNPV